MPDTYSAFPSIPRLLRDIIITEKIDGTNAQIVVGEDGSVRAGSRNRWITPDDDNYGFARWVQENEEELRKLGPGSHFGEWWGNGIQRRYGLDHKRFSLFNVSRWKCDGNESYSCIRTDRQYVCNEVRCCHVVPVLYQGQFDMEQIALRLDSLKDTGSVAAKWFMKPEGIVIYHTKGQTLWKVTLDGDGHKGNG